LGRWPRLISPDHRAVYRGQLAWMNLRSVPKLLVVVLARHRSRVEA